MTSDDKLKEIAKQAWIGANTPGHDGRKDILAALQQARELGREEERKALREIVVRKTDGTWLRGDDAILDAQSSQGHNAAMESQDDD